MFRARTIRANRRRENAYGAASGGTTPPLRVSGKHMTFEIKSIDQAMFDAVYTPGLTHRLNRFIHPTRDWFDLSPRLWVVDPARNASFLEVSLVDRMNWAFSYVLIQDGEFALVRAEGHGRYSFVTVSAGFASRLDEAKCLVAEALRVGGVFLDGCYDPPSGVGMNLRHTNAVPDVEFITRKTRKAE
jgi:hypothetical protein